MTINALRRWSTRQRPTSPAWRTFVPGGVGTTADLVRPELPLRPRSGGYCPMRLVRRLDTVLESLTFTAPPREFPALDTVIPLVIADEVHHHRPVSIRYTAVGGQRSDRTLHPYKLIAHSGRSPRAARLARSA